MGRDTSGQSGLGRPCEEGGWELGLRGWIRTRKPRERGVKSLVWARSEVSATEWTRPVRSIQRKSRWLVIGEACDSCNNAYIPAVVGHRGRKVWQAWRERYEVLTISGHIHLNRVGYRSKRQLRFERIILSIKSYRCRLESPLPLLSHPRWNV